MFWPAGSRHLPEWVPDSTCSQCSACRSPFTLLRRRHHCRSCGKVGRGWDGACGVPPWTQLCSTPLCPLCRSSVPAAHQIPRCCPTMARPNPFESALTATPHTCHLHPAVPGASESPSARSSSQEAAQLGAQGRFGAAGQHLGPVTLLRAWWAWRQDPPTWFRPAPMHRGRTSYGGSPYGVMVGAGPPLLVHRGLLCFR